MKSTAHFVWMVLVLLIVAPAQAKDGVGLSYPSKVEGSKSKDREKLFTPWMTSEGLATQTAERGIKGEQIIYFEYNNGTKMTRAIFVSTVKLNGPYTRWSFSSEQAMEEKVKSETKNGLQPAFVVRNINDAYTMLFVSPQDLDAVRKALKELGIGEPKLKK